MGARDWFSLLLNHSITKNWHDIILLGFLSTYVGILLIVNFQSTAGFAIFWLMVLPFGGEPALAAPTLAPSDPHVARDIVVNIKTRQFDPATVSLQSGEKVRLILRNQDVELHAFRSNQFISKCHLTSEWKWSSGIWTSRAPSDPASLKGANRNFVRT